MRILILLIVCALSLQEKISQLQFAKWIPLRPLLAYEESSAGLLDAPQLDGGPIGLEMGDVNHDGFVDIVSIGDHGCPYIGTQEHGIMVWFGNGTAAGWSSFMNGEFGYGGIALGDVNNDGLIDAGYGMHHAYSSSDFGDQLIEVALGNGTGRVWTPWDDGLAEHGQTWGMFDTDFADFDCDGDLDLVSISFGSGDGLHVYLNNGDGTWTQSFGMLGGNTDSFLCTGDVNNDGFADIAAGYQGGTVFLGDGAGSFVNADGNLPAPGSWGHFYGVDLGDVDGDGCQDLSYCTSAGAVRLWRWPPGDRWLPLSQGLPASGPHTFTQLCDMDADGQMDLATFGSGIVKVWQIDHTATWNETVSFSIGSSGGAEALRTGFDVDFNGRPDMALVAREGSWPNDHNNLHFFRESMQARRPAVRLTYPTGNELLCRGAVVFIDWVSEVPHGHGGSSLMTVQLSLAGTAGPWIDIATDIPNNGRFQWRISTGLPASNNCLLRAKLSSASGPDSYTMTRAFVLS
ncbi:MAG: VCBS repeat-containing protein [Planctomycetota bacterium]